MAAERRGGGRSDAPCELSEKGKGERVSRDAEGREPWIQRETGQEMRGTKRGAFGRGAFAARTALTGKHVNGRRGTDKGAAEGTAAPRVAEGKIQRRHRRHDTTQRTAAAPRSVGVEGNDPRRRGGGRRRTTRPGETSEARQPTAKRPRVTRRHRDTTHSDAGRRRRRRRPRGGLTDQQGTEGRSGAGRSV